MSDIRSVMRTANVLPPEHPEEKIRRAATALADIQKMQQDNIAMTDEIVGLRKTIDELRRQIDHMTAVHADQLKLRTDEIKTVRHERNVFHKSLLELATSTANICLLARKSEEIVQSLAERLDEETPEQAATERKSANDIVSRIVENNPRPGDTPTEQIERALSVQ